MYELILFVFAIFSMLIYIYLRWNFNYWQKRGIRGPKPAILVGNFIKSARGEVNYMDELNEIYLKYKNSEKFVGIFSSRNPRLFILDPEIVRQILRTNFSNFYNNESSKWSIPHIDLLRMQSPFVSVGKTWKEKRREIVTALTGNRIRSSYPAMQEIAHKLSDLLRAHDGKDIDAKESSIPKKICYNLNVTKQGFSVKNNKDNKISIHGKIIFITNSNFYFLFILETLRLFPVNPTFTKICTTPTTLENSDGRTIELKQGDIVHISAYSFHKDKEFFEKPEEFMPERFDPEIGGYRKYRDRGVFLPFSDGPRMCLGMKLGLLETKIAVAKIVQNFKINFSSSTRMDNRCDPKKIASFLDGGIRLQFEGFK
ncbi:probable cytochrome P450 28d2 [Episyrphus balteatus]|uniref:probable cytochrome P450 28d2 n=1 Tax=Episyrphus balteatus TaxID=286459 RepID=UPI002486B6D9|nr:probable cytochrome P450 28d2 [Episyrphus balteatus]